MDAFVDLITRLKETMDKAGDATGSLGRAAKQAEDNLKRMERSAKHARDGLEDLQKDMKDGSVDILDSLGTFKQLQEQLRKNTGSIDQESLARIKNIKNQIIGASVVQGLTNSLQGAATAMIDLAINNFKTLVSELQGSGNAFNMVTIMAKQSIDATNKMSQAVASGGESVGAVLTAVLPGYFKLLGVAVMGLAKLFGYTAEKTADLAKFGLETLNTEVQKTMKSYQVSTKAGIFFANGMTEMAKTAHEAGVSYRDFLEAVSKSSTDLALLGGNAGAGAVAVSKTFKALEPFRRGLLNIGANMEDQIQGTAEYMANLAQANQLKGKSDAELAKGVDAYITNLKVISSITGEEVKAAQSRARKAAEQSAVQNTLNTLEGDARNKFLTGIKLLPTGMEAALQQMLVSGTITSTELAIAADQIPGLRTQVEQLAEGIKNTNVTSEQMRQNYLNNLTDPSLAEGLKRFNSGVGLANILINKFGVESGIASQIEQQIGKAARGEAIEAGQLVEDTKTTTDKLTKTISDVTVQFNKLQASIEQDLQRPMENYARFVEEMLKQLRDTLDKLGYGPGSSTNGKTPEQIKEERAAKWRQGNQNVLPVPRDAKGNPDYKAEVTDEEKRRVEEAGGYGGNPTRRMPRVIRDRLERERLEREKQAAQARIKPITYTDGTPVVPLIPPYNPAEMPKKADGGIATSPSIVGEAGPEAVIPLKNGAIPLDINFSEMLAELRDQTLFARELLDQMRDSKDIQQQILYATA